MPRWMRMVAVGALVLFGLAACDSGGSGGDLAAFCQLGAELDEQDDFPTDEQLDAWADEAPDEIADEAEAAAEQFKDAETDQAKESLFQDPEFTDRIEVVEAFEEENCDRDDPDTDEGDGEVSAPGAGSDYCNLVEEINSADAPPTPEQLESYKELAPEEISGVATTVADAFLAAGDDIGAVFADPEVEEQLGQLEAFEAEHCGTASDEGEEDEELETEPAEGANVVEITGVDFDFEGVPSEVAAGSTAFGFTNGGESAHEMIVFHLQEGKTAEDVLALEGEDDPAAAEVVAGEVGGTFGTPDSETSYVNAEVEPGTYALLCFIPGPGGESHAELGMQATFTVA